jgi:hypothetical protein
MSEQSILLHTQAVIRDNNLRAETIDTLDDAIQLLSDLGRTDLSEQIHQVLLQIDSFKNKHKDLQMGIVIELFAERMQPSA